MGSADSIQSDLSSAFVLTISIALAIECIGGLTFNFIVLLTYHKSFKLQKTENFLIINLNVVDILICLTAIPITLVLLQNYQEQWPGLACYFHQANISLVSTASAITLLTISIDRYEAVVTPLKKKVIQLNMKKTLLAIWFMSIVGFCSPFFGVDFTTLSEMSARPVEPTGQPQMNTSQNSAFLNALSGTTDAVADATSSDQCFSTPTCHCFINSKHFFPFHEAYFMFFFFLCMSGMIVCYYHIFRVAKQRLAVRLALIRATLAFTGGSTAEESLWKVQDRRLTKMTLAIVSTFVICWGPHIIVSCVGLRIQTVTVEMLRFVGLTVAFSTALLHPLLYTFMRQDFRRALKNRWMSQKVLRKGFRNRKVGTDASAANNGSVWTLTRDTVHDTLSAG